MYFKIILVFFFQWLHDCINVYTKYYISYLLFIMIVFYDCIMNIRFAIYE